MFITGTYAIIAAASALNNGRGEDNKAQVKSITVQNREYPYVTAQAKRYWLRETLKKYDPAWRTAPITRTASGKQQVYTEGNPIQYWDDDLFGYMRAEKGGTRSRIAPFRTSTLVSSAPAEIVRDFGVMARLEDNPVLYQHEFYRSVLVGSFSIDLSAVGTFTYQNRSGLFNLNQEQCQFAEEMGLEHLPERKAFRMPLQERMQRVSSVLQAMGRLEGGANQTRHYTDVSPVFATIAVLKNGNNPFMNLIAPKSDLEVDELALREALEVYRDDFLSPLYVGLRQGVSHRSQQVLTEHKLDVAHPRQAFDALAADLFQNPEWFV